jgi:predicted permease
MNLLGWTLQGPVDRTAAYLQGAVTPCALFSLGASLTRYRVVGALAEPAVAVGLKNLVMPALVWLGSRYVLGLAPTWTAAATLLAAQPSGVNVYLFAERYSAAKGLATTTVFLSTSLSVLTISALLYLLR